MADVAWPVGLINSLESAKQVERGAGWRESPVASGPAFVERLSDDTPTFFDVGFRFTRSQARVFDAWLKFYDMQTSPVFFDFPVKIPDTNQEFQEVRFTGNVPQRTGQNGVAWTYTGRVMARSIISPDLDDPEMILTLGILSNYGDIDQYAEFLDIAINVAAPGN